MLLQSCAVLCFFCVVYTTTKENTLYGNMHPKTNSIWRMKYNILFGFCFAVFFFFTCDTIFTKTLTVKSDPLLNTKKKFRRSNGIELAKFIEIQKELIHNRAEKHYFLLVFLFRSHFVRIFVWLLLNTFWPNAYCIHVFCIYIHIFQLVLVEISTFNSCKTCCSTDSSDFTFLGVRVVDENTANSTVEIFTLF